MYIALLSIHGLIRGRNLELGRDDADAGGQTLYVVELALASHSAVSRIDLVTRRVVDAEVSTVYAEVISPAGSNRTSRGVRRFGFMEGEFVQ